MMELPTSRELELEALLRQRDAQLSELHDEVTHLRQYLPSQLSPSTTETLTLPPAVSSIILSQISVATDATGSSSNSTVVAALTQRAQLLQEENDELYELLKHGETGRLKEEVRALRRLVQRLQNALHQSHSTIDILSRELDKSYESLTNVAPPVPSPQVSPRIYSSSPRARYSTPAIGNMGSHPPSKPPPTGPRAQKRPRLSEPNTQSTVQSHYPGRSHGTSSHNHYGHNPLKRGVDGHPKRSERERDLRGSNDISRTIPSSNTNKMDIDNERLSRDQDMEPIYDKDRGRERDRERDRDKGSKELGHAKERERDRGSTNNAMNRRSGGGQGRMGSRRGERFGSGPHVSNTGGNVVSSNGYNPSGDRTLAERMGL